MGLAFRRRYCWWSWAVHLLGAERTLGTAVRVFFGNDRIHNDSRPLAPVFLPQLPRHICSPQSRGYEIGNPEGVIQQFICSVFAPF